MGPENSGHEARRHAKAGLRGQEERRREVIRLRESGLSYEAIGRKIGLSRTGVTGICKRFAAHGPAGLKSGRRGPPPGSGRLLTAGQELEFRRLICSKTPNACGLPFAQWSRAAVGALIEQSCGVQLAMRTISLYLARWKFTPKKPLQVGYEQRPDPMQRWL